MKRSIQFLLLLASILVLQTACKKEDDTMPPADDCQIRANVDGVDYRWDLLTCSRTGQKLRVGDIAVDEAEFTLEPIDGTGSFATINPNFDITFFLTLGPADQIFAADVEIQITSFTNNRAAGTFEGIFTDITGTNYQVANGRFNAVY